MSFSQRYTKVPLFFGGFVKYLERRITGPGKKSMKPQKAKHMKKRKSGSFCTFQVDYPKEIKHIIEKSK